MPAQPIHPKALKIVESMPKPSCQECIGSCCAYYSISNIEISFSTAKKMAAYLGITLDVLYAEYIEKDHGWLLLRVDQDGICKFFQDG